MNRTNTNTLLQAFGRRAQTLCEGWRILKTVKAGRDVMALEGDHCRGRALESDDDAKLSTDQIQRILVLVWLDALQHTSNPLLGRRRRGSPLVRPNRTFRATRFVRGCTVLHATCRHFQGQYLLLMSHQVGY